MGLFHFLNWWFSTPKKKKKKNQDFDIQENGFLFLFLYFIYIYIYSFSFFDVFFGKMDDSFEKGLSKSRQRSVKHQQD